MLDLSAPRSTSSWQEVLQDGVDSDHEYGKYRQAVAHLPRADRTAVANSAAAASGHSQPLSLWGPGVGSLLQPAWDAAGPRPRGAGPAPGHGAGPGPTRSGGGSAFPDCVPGDAYAAEAYGDAAADLDPEVLAVVVARALAAHGMALPQLQYDLAAATAAPLPPPQQQRRGGHQGRHHGASWRAGGAYLQEPAGPGGSPLLRDANGLKLVRVSPVLPAAPPLPPHASPPQAPSDIQLARTQLQLQQQQLWQVKQLPSEVAEGAALPLTRRGPGVLDLFGSGGGRGAAPQGGRDGPPSQLVLPWLAAAGDGYWQGHNAALEGAAAQVAPVPDPARPQAKVAAMPPPLPWPPLPYEALDDVQPAKRVQHRRQKQQREAPRALRAAVPAEAAEESPVTAAALLIPHAFVSRGIPHARPGDQLPVVLTVDDGSRGGGAAEATAAASGHFPGALVVQLDGSGVLADEPISKAIAKYQGWRTVGWQVARLDESLGGVYWVEWRVRKPAVAAVAVTAPPGGETVAAVPDEEKLLEELKALGRQQQALQEQLAWMQARRATAGVQQQQQQQLQPRVGYRSVALPQHPTGPQGSEQRRWEQQQQQLQLHQNQLLLLRQEAQPRLEAAEAGLDWVEGVEQQAGEGRARGPAQAGWQERQRQQPPPLVTVMASPSQPILELAAWSADGSIQADGCAPPQAPLARLSTRVASFRGKGHGRVALADPWDAAGEDTAAGSGRGRSSDSSVQAAPAAGGGGGGPRAVAERRTAQALVVHPAEVAVAAAAPPLLSLQRQQLWVAGLADTKEFREGEAPSLGAPRSADDSSGQSAARGGEDDGKPWQPSLPTAAGTAAAAATAARESGADAAAPSLPLSRSAGGASAGGAAAAAATDGAAAGLDDDPVVARSAPRLMSRYLTSGEIRLLFTERDSRVLCNPPCGLLLSVQMFLDGQTLGPPQEAQLCRYNSSSPRYLTSVPSQELTSPPIPWKRLVGTTIRYRRCRSGLLQLWATHGDAAAGDASVVQLTAKAAAAMPKLVSFKPAGLRRAAFLAASGGSAAGDGDGDGDADGGDGDAEVEGDGDGDAGAFQRVGSGVTAMDMPLPLLRWATDAATHGSAGSRSPQCGRHEGDGPGGADPAAAAHLHPDALGTSMAAGRDGGSGGSGGGEDTAAQEAAARRALALLTATAIKSELLNADGQTAGLVAQVPDPNDPNDPRGGPNYLFPAGGVAAVARPRVAQGPPRRSHEGKGPDPPYCTEVLVACPPRLLSRYVTKAELEILVGEEVYEQLCGGNKLADVRVMFEVNGRRLPEVFIADIERYNPSSPFYLKAASGRGVDGLPWRSVPPNATVQWRRMADNTLVLAHVPNPVRRDSSGAAVRGGGGRHCIGGGGAKRHGGNGGGGGRARRRRSAEDDTDSMCDMSDAEYGSGSGGSDTDTPAARKRRRGRRQLSDAPAWDASQGEADGSSALRLLGALVGAAGGAADAEAEAAAEAEEEEEQGGGGGGRQKRCRAAPELGRPSHDSKTTGGLRAADAPRDEQYTNGSVGAAAAAVAAAGHAPTCGPRAAAGLGVLTGSSPPRQHPAGSDGGAAAGGACGSGGGSSFISRIVATNLYIGRRQLQALYGASFKADTKSHLQLSLNGALMPELYHVQWKEGCHKGSFYPKGAPLGQLRGRFLEGIHWLDQQRNLLVALAWDQPPAGWPVRRRRMASATSASRAAAKPRRWLWQRQAERAKKAAAAAAPAEEGGAASAAAPLPPPPPAGTARLLAAPGPGPGLEISGGFGRLQCTGDHGGGAGVSGAGSTRSGGLGLGLGGPMGEADVPGGPEGVGGAPGLREEEAVEVDREAAEAQEAEQVAEPQVAAAQEATTGAPGGVSPGRHVHVMAGELVARKHEHGAGAGLGAGLVAAPFAALARAVGDEAEVEAPAEGDGQPLCNGRVSSGTTAQGDARGAATAAGAPLLPPPPVSPGVQRLPQQQQQQQQADGCMRQSSGCPGGLQGGIALDAAGVQAAPADAAAGPDCVAAAALQAQPERPAAAPALTGAAATAAEGAAAEGAATAVAAGPVLCAKRRRGQSEDGGGEEVPGAGRTAAAALGGQRGSVPEAGDQKRLRVLDLSGGWGARGAPPRLPRHPQEYGQQERQERPETSPSLGWFNPPRERGCDAATAAAAASSVGGPGGGARTSGEDCSTDDYLGPVPARESPPHPPPLPERGGGGVATVAARGLWVGGGGGGGGAVAHAPAALQVLQLARDGGGGGGMLAPPCHPRQRYKTSGGADGGSRQQLSTVLAPLLEAVGQPMTAVEAAAECSLAAIEERGGGAPGHGGLRGDDAVYGDGRDGGDCLYESTEELVIRSMPWISMHLAQKWYPNAVFSAGQAPYPVHVAIEADGVLQPERYPAQFKSYPFNKSLFLPGLPVKQVKDMIRIGWRKLPDQTLVLVVRSTNAANAAGASAGAGEPQLYQQHQLGDQQQQQDEA